METKGLATPEVTGAFENVHSKCRGVGTHTRFTEMPNGP